MGYSPSVTFHRLHFFHLVSFNELFHIDANLFSKENAVLADVLFEGLVVKQDTRPNDLSLFDFLTQDVVLKNQFVVRIAFIKLRKVASSLYSGDCVPSWCRFCLFLLGDSVFLI